MKNNISFNNLTLFRPVHFVVYRIHWQQEVWEYHTRKWLRNVHSIHNSVSFIARFVGETLIRKILKMILNYYFKFISDLKISP